jgi:cellulose synthase/poly-beta-1,6-N-acetylglucosamine synthase-like glycosyltransferase
VPADRVELVLWITYLLLGPITWLGYGFVMYAGRKKMRLLYKRPPLPPGEAPPPPHVTILIPAKDEQARIRACLESALAQDYPNLDVVAIDDRSGDRTGAIMDEVAAADPRLKVVHLTEPPEFGWTGKNRALHVAQQHARGDWLLFVDSDVVLRPDALPASMDVMRRKKGDMISLLPRLESESLWESLLVPLCASTAAGMYLIALNNSERQRTAFANGQFILIRRAAYDLIGGHSKIRDRLCEDIEIARLLKAHGLRTRVAWGNEVCSVRMYDNLPAILRGWSRIYYAGGVGSPWRILGAMAFVLLCTLSAYVAMAWGLWRLAHPVVLGPGLFAAGAWLGAGLLHLALLTFFVGTLYAWSGNPRRNALWLPLSGSFLIFILARALRMCFTKRVEWRGVAYSHTMDPNLAKNAAAAAAASRGEAAPSSAMPDPAR